ncbi:C-type lectin domain family 4 member E-like [Cydia fagiglandana]|uniref:C-type lectin domain family 4 member E-like n=1 Tax=Cydia fagiglandana TaxID=1458189 RepID=UPI002FEE58F3
MRKRLAKQSSHQYVDGVLDHSYEYVPEADAWLRLHIVPAKWKNAFRRCQLEGGVLASPSSHALAKAMLAIMTEYKVNSRSVFTGINALVSEGDYISLDGVPLHDIHLDWAQGEPSAQDDPNDPDENERCVVLNGSGEASDVSCNTKHPYFCRKENSSMANYQDCHTSAVGYHYEPRTSSCYKFHSNAKMWNEAAKVCHAEGGHLAIVNSDVEAEVLKEIFAKNPAKTVTGAKHDDVAIVGFWKWGDNIDGDWLTIYGQPISEAGFAKWGKGQPNNYNGVQHWGSIQRTGLFDDITDYDREPFFCEINLEKKY